MTKPTVLKCQSTKGNQLVLQTWRKGGSQCDKCEIYSVCNILL